MRQITIIQHQPGAFLLGGINDKGERADYEVTEDRLELIQALNESLDEEKSPEDQAQEDMLGYVKETAPDELLVQLKAFWPKWEDFIGQRLPEGELVVYNDLLYRCTREIDVLAHYPPPLVPGHYEAIGHTPTPGEPDEPKEYPQWSQQGWEFGAIVWNYDRLWENVLEGQANIWEPGTPGIDDRYWIDVTERELGDG